MSKTGALRTSEAKEQPGMTAREIRATLVLRGITIKDIADQAGVTGSAVTQTINQYPYNRFKGYRIRQYIAQALGKSIEDIWP